MSNQAQNPYTASLTRYFSTPESQSASSLTSSSIDGNTKSMSLNARDYQSTNDNDRVHDPEDLDDVPNEYPDDVLNEDDREEFDPSISSKRLRRSEYWCHFESFLDPVTKLKMASCHYCAKKIKSHNGTGPLKSHYNSCTRKPSSARGPKQATLNFGAKLIPQKTQELTREKLVHMIIRCELPFSFVETDGFKDFFELVCPDYKLISRFTVVRDCLTLRELEKSYIMKLLKESVSRISFTTDIWTGRKKQGDDSISQFTLSRIMNCLFFFHRIYGYNCTFL
jgi:hypothetical protein